MQVWSRSRMSWPNQPSKCRRVESPPTTGPEPVEVVGGAVKSRRHHLRPRLLARISRASSAGSGSCPWITAAVSLLGLGLIRVSSGISSCSSMLTSAAWVCPVRRSTRVSAMI